jgi:hypothetical protein
MEHLKVMVDDVPARHASTEGPNSSWRVWSDQSAQFTERKICPIRHNLHQHPLLQLPQLAQLAKTLMPLGQCRFMNAGATQSSALDDVLHNASPDGRSIDEVFARLDEPGSWIAMYNVEAEPRYAALLAEIIGSTHPLLKRAHPGVSKVSGYVFISAPPSVTPFHIDHENNFWLQLLGRKTINVWDHTDRDVVSARAVENFVLFNSLDDVRLKDELRSRSQEFHAGPGDGVYFPSTSPHMTRSERDWVRPGDGVSASMGVVFFTRETQQNARVYQLNHYLRRAGLTPRPPGQSRLRDALKAPLGHMLAQARRRLHHVAYTPPGLE